MAGVKTPVSGTLLTEERFVELLNEQTEVIKKLIATQPVPEPEPEPEPLKKCKRGPKVEDVTKKSDTRIAVLFDADDVHKILATIKIKDSGKSVVIADIISSSTGKSLLLDNKSPGFFGPDNNTPIIVLASKMEPVRHTITFKAIDCTGENSRDFFFDDVVAPPPEEEKPCIPTGRINSVEFTQI